MCAGDPAPPGGTGLASQGKCLVGQPGWSRARLTPGCRRPTQALELVVAWVLAAVTATGTCLCGVFGQALRGLILPVGTVGFGAQKGALLHRLVGPGGAHPLPVPIRGGGGGWESVP